jgi:hypothetical protein
LSDPGPFASIVRQILEGGAPPQVRSAAARGALPLPRSALVRLYLALRTDDDPGIRGAAERSLETLQPDAVREILEDEGCAPEVLEYFAQRFPRDEGMAERIAFHRSVPRGALEVLAGQGTAAVIELVLTNQERLLAQPTLLDRLSVNPALRPDQRGRILELLDRATRVAAARAAASQASPERADEAVTAEIEEAARLLEVDIGELFTASEILGGEEFEQADDPELRSAYRRILTLSTAQKAILAMRGGREERLILIRDSNRLVAAAVLRNPRVRDEDAEAFARMRNVSGDVLRQIGQNREWSKSYSVVAALVNNPKTPPGVSTNFVPRLQNQDLKRLVANHEVPELIRRMARRTLDVRTQQRTEIGKRRP